MSLITKAIDKFPSLSSKTKDSSPNNTVSGRKSSDPNAIPPEPVQLQPGGDFRHQEQGPALQTLNFARANKRSGALAWDNHLGDDAEKWAEKLASSGGVESNDSRVPVASPDKVEDGEAMHQQGQCISAHENGEPTYDDAVRAWLKEETRYDGQVIQDGEADYKGYTQCMWSDSKHVGIGKAKASNGTWYVVARFTPAGNIAGQRPFQVSSGGI